MSNASDTKQLTDDETLERLKAISFFSEEHPDEWRNRVARDLKDLVGREVATIVTHGYASDYAAAVIRIVERVAEFEEIKVKRVYPDLNL